MTKLFLSLAVFTTLCFVLPGCATMRYPRDYKVEGHEFREFKEMDDDHALKTVALIYNVRHDEWEDSIARSIALDEYLKLLAKRKSAYIKNSGILEVKYTKVDISAWTDDELEKLCDLLVPKAEAYYKEDVEGLSEIKNAERIVYVTALNSTMRELKKRSNTRDAIMVATQVLGAVVTIALGMI